MSHRFSLLFVLALAMPAAAADVTATTEDGRKVILRDNGTWVPADADDEKKKREARLVLENRAGLANGCRLGLRLHNELPAQIRTLVLRFTAYKGAEVPFETVSRGFSFLKPTTSQYREVTFRGIGCDQISSVEVFAARNCHVGELTKYSATAADCLKLFSVDASDLMAIAKRAED